MNVDYDVDGSWIFAGCTVTALQPADESFSVDDSRCIGSPVIIFNALRCAAVGQPSVAGSSGRSFGFIAGYPGTVRKRERRVSAALIPRYLATLFSLIRSFHFPCHGL